MNKKELILHIWLLSFAFVTGFFASIDTQNWLVLYVLLFSVVIGATAWSIGNIISERFARLFFYLQKFSWFHFMIKPELLKDKNYFLTAAPNNSASSLFLLWIGSWALVVFIAYNLVFTFGITLPKGDAVLSSNFDVLLLAWILTPIVSLVVIPISIIESSNLRLFLKIKEKIISPTTPFRYVIGGFFTMNVLQSMLRGLDTAELMTSLVYLPVPFYVMTLLYRYRTENRLVSNFIEYLKTKGITKKDISLD